MQSFSVKQIFRKKRDEFSFRQLLRRIFVDDWLMKLIALMITLALWLVVTGLSPPTEERIRGVALNFRVSNEMEITDPSFQATDLVLVGDRNKIDKIKREDLSLSLNLVDTPPGKRSIELTRDNVNIELPTGVKLKEMEPSKLSFTLELVESREIVVKAETVNNVPDGFEVYGVSVVPQKVPARGPASYIEAIDYISTDKIDLKNQRQDFAKQQVPLNTTNPKITVIDETTVDVFFRIGEKRIERLFIVPVSKADEQRTATVVLFGARSVLNSLSSKEISVRLEKSDSSPDSLSLTLPADVQQQVEIRRLQINGR